MKKFVALVSVSLLFLALLFKSLEWPGADQLLILAVGLFYPLFYLFDLIVEWKTGKARLATALYFLGAFFLAEGLLFKLMHWPGGTDLLIISLGLVLPIFLIVRAIQQPRNEVAARFSVLLFIALSWFSLFSLLHFPGKVILLVAVLILAMLVVLYELVKKEGQPIFQLVKHRHLVNASAIVAFLIIIDSRQISVRALESEITRQIDLQEKIDQELEFGTQEPSSGDSKSIRDIDQQTADLLKTIDEVKLSLIQEVNNGIGPIRNADQQAILWEKPAIASKPGIVTLNLSALTNKTNVDIPMYRLIGDNLTVLNRHSAGLRIWNDWIQLQTQFQKAVAAHPNLDSTSRTQLLGKLQKIQNHWQEQEYQPYHDLRNIHWVARTFDHATIVQAIVRLTELQYEVVRLRTLVVG
jgi:Ca2+/Na+ antiporter